MKLTHKILKLKQNITGTHVLILGLIFVVSMLIMRQAAGQVAANAGGVSILDLNIGNSPDFIRQTVTALGEGGRIAYLKFYLVDTFYPLIYAAFYSSWIIVLLRYCRAGQKLRWLKFLPILPWIAMIFDWLENLMIGGLLLVFPNAWQPLYYLANFATIAKFGMIALTIACIIVLIGDFLVQKITQHKQKST